mgnify:FL=1
MNIPNHAYECITKCPICDNSDFSNFYNYGAPFKKDVSNNICKSCGLIIQSPRPTFEHLETYYEGYSELSQTKRILKIENEYFFMSIAKLRYNFLEPFLSDDMQVLDVGCGPGCLLSLIKGKVKSTLGGNPEASYASFGMQKYNIEIKVGMFEDVELPENSFDLIIFDHVFEHLNNPNEVLLKVTKLLKSNGKIFFSTPNALKVHGFLWQNYFHDHAFTYSRNTLRRLLQKYGFDEINFDTTGHVTYQKYHYPYMDLLFERKSGIQNICNGDNYIEVEQYLTSYARDQTSKRKYVDWIIEKVRRIYPGNPTLATLVYYFLIIAGFNWSKRIFNNTLPPERDKYKSYD